VFTRSSKRTPRSDQGLADLLDRGRQPVGGDRARAAGRARAGRLQQVAGKFDLAASTPRRAACRRIEVAFDIDANGILHVSGQGQEDRQGQRIEIKAGSA
jgi:molecular chaperone DnaK (HSP70)